MDNQKIVEESLDEGIRIMWDNPDIESGSLKAYRAIIESFENMGYEVTYYKITAEVMIEEYNKKNEEIQKRD
ncbi:hypothetical protein KY343_07165 [Candidatus Woesearchaeota archaeon]|nr:hypothetical protein [Candidatus Woesearchaeota archaeon]